MLPEFLLLPKMGTVEELTAVIAPFSFLFVPEVVSLLLGVPNILTGAVLVGLTTALSLDLLFPKMLTPDATDVLGVSFSLLFGTPKIPTSAGALLPLSTALGVPKILADGVVTLDVVPTVGTFLSFSLSLDVPNAVDTAVVVAFSLPKSGLIMPTAFSLFFVETKRPEDIFVVSFSLFDFAMGNIPEGTVETLAAEDEDD